MPSINDLTFTADLVVGDNGETCPYPWHLGTIPAVAGSCAMEIFHHYVLVPARIRAVRLKRGGVVAATYDGRVWQPA